jgi:hypothetical protein
MAKSGTWSNVGDWLFYCLMNVRGKRIAIHCDGQYRSLFTNEISSAFTHFSALSAEDRGHFGLNALDVQGSLRTLLANRNCITVPGILGTIRVMPFGKAMKAETGSSLVIGISLTNPLPDASKFALVCEYGRRAPACSLPRVTTVPERVEPVILQPTPRPISLEEKAFQTIRQQNPRSSTLLGLDEEDSARTDDPMEIISSESDEKVEFSEYEKDAADDEKDEATSAFFSKCPICLEVPFPPWKTTTCGHLICTECHAALPTRTKCPTCRSDCATTLVPQLLFEEVAKANAVKLRCRYDECKKRIPWDMARAHHDSCVHKHQECPWHRLTGYKDKGSAVPCHWKGPLGSIGKHIMDDHGALEDVQESFTLTEHNEGDTFVWTPRRVLLTVLRSSSEFAKGITVRMTSLQSHSVHLKLETSVKDEYKGNCVIKVAPLTTIPFTTAFFPCRHPKTPFGIVVQWDDGSVMKKRDRVEVVQIDDEKGGEDDYAAMPPLKEARKE